LLIESTLHGQIRETERVSTLTQNKEYSFLVTSKEKLVCKFILYISYLIASILYQVMCNVHIDQVQNVFVSDNRLTDVYLIVKSLKLE